MDVSSSKRVRLITLGVLFLVFVAGFMVGFAVNRSLTAGPPAEAGRERDERDDHDDDGRRERRYVIDEIEMDPQRRSRVDSIIAFHRQRTKELSEEFEEEFRPRYRRIVSETREAIKSVLTAEQAAAYDSLLAERARHRSRRDGDSGRREKRER